MEKKKYLLVWWSDMGDVEELDYDELKEFLYEEVDDGKKMYEDIEVKAVSYTHLTLPTNA